MKNKIFLIASICISIIACNPPSKNPNQTIYFNGDIITMEGENPQYVEALIEEGGKILFAGTLAEAEKQYDPANMIDLQGRTLLPGFIDGHAHFDNFSFQAIGAQILPPPDAGAKDIPTLINILKE